jgi:hypothetical protein
VAFRVIKTRRMRCAACVACVGDIRNAYKVLEGIPEGKRSLGRPRHKWDCNIKIKLK